MTYVAQEKEGLQDAEEVSAAIQEAIKGIPYPSNEVVTETIDFGVLSPSSYDKNSSYIEVGQIEFGKIKKYNLTLKVTISKNAATVNAIGVLILPNGGLYLILSGSDTDLVISGDPYAVVSGGSELSRIEVRKNLTGSSNVTETKVINLYLARIA